MSEAQQTTAPIQMVPAEFRNSVFREVWDWAKKQGPVVVVLLVILFLLVGGLAYGMRYTVLTLAPEHLAAIQAGYERIQQDANDHAKDITTRYLEDKAATREAHTRELMAISAEFRAIANQMQEVAKKQDDLIRTFILKERASAQ